MGKKEKIVGSVVLAIVFLLCLFIGYLITRPINTKSEDIFELQPTTELRTPASTAVAMEKITVEVKGQVANPGVYTLNKGSIVLDLVNAAGGYLKGADVESIIQCTKLSDGDCLKVMKIGDTSANNIQSNVTTSNLQSVSGDSVNIKININSASKDQLMSLNGIGETRAEAIIQYREKNGPFKTIEDIKKAGARIGETIFNNIKDNIVVK